MKKITCVHTGMGGLPGVIEKTFTEVLGEVKFHHILDSGLIGDVVAADGVTPQLEKRLYALFDAAATTEPDMIVSTCSSIGDVARKYAAEHPELSVLSIDYPMAEYAAEKGHKVAVLATLATTVEPSANLVADLARKAGREVEVVKAVAPGAFEAVINGDMAKAAEFVQKTAEEACRGADMVLLAQASMSAFRKELEEELGKEAEILESPAVCAAYLRENL